MHIWFIKGISNKEQNVFVKSSKMSIWTFESFFVSEKICSFHPNFALTPMMWTVLLELDILKKSIDFHMFYTCLQGKMPHEWWKDEEVYMQLMSFLWRGLRMYEIRSRWTELLFAWYPEWCLVLSINPDQSEFAKDFVFQSMLQLEMGTRRLLHLTLQSAHAQKLNGKKTKNI